MKLKRIYLLLSFVLLIVISTNAIRVNAMNTGFFTEDLSDETKTTFVASINVSPLSAEPEKRGVLCFDVNEQGLIAIGQRVPKTKRFAYIRLKESSCMDIRSIVLKVFVLNGMSNTLIFISFVAM